MVTSTQRFSVGGGKNLFHDPSFLRRGSEILGTNISTVGEWEIMLTLERSADPAFLLPANRERLSGETIVKFTVINRNTGNTYYLEAPITDPSLFAQYQAIAWRPSVNNRDAINNNVHWYLNHNTIHGAANGVASLGDQAGFAYNLTRIRQSIGHQPFNQAFDYFANLSAANMPSTQLGRVNLFLTKLRDFSGRDVIGMLSPQALLDIERLLGGRIGYAIDNEFQFPIGMTWLVIDDEEFQTQILVSNARANFGPYRNVYIGISRILGNTHRDVYIQQGDEWEFVGILVSDDSNPMSRTTTHYHFINGGGNPPQPIDVLRISDLAPPTTSAEVRRAGSLFTMAAFVFVYTLLNGIFADAQIMYSIDWANLTPQEINIIGVGIAVSLDNNFTFGLIGLVSTIMFGAGDHAHIHRNEPLFWLGMKIGDTASLALLVKTLTAITPLIPKAWKAIGLTAVGGPTVIAGAAGAIGVTALAAVNVAMISRAATNLSNSTAQLRVTSGRPERFTTPTEPGVVPSTNRAPRGVGDSPGSGLGFDTFDELKGIWVMPRKGTMAPHRRASTDG